MAVTKESYYRRQVEKGKISASDYNRIMSTGKSANKYTPMKTSSSKISSSSKSSSSNKSSSSSSNSFSKYTSMDWGSAAEAAKKAGIDTSTGSAFDLAMNKKYNPQNYASLVSKNSNIGPWAAGYGSETEYGPNGTKTGNTNSKSSNSSSNKSQKSTPIVNTNQRTDALDAIKSGALGVLGPKFNPSSILGSIGRSVNPIGSILNLGKSFTNPYDELSKALGLSSGPMEFNIGDNMSPSEIEQAYTTLDNPGGGVYDQLNPDNNLPGQVDYNAPNRGSAFANAWSGVTGSDISRSSNRNTPSPVKNPTPTYIPPTYVQPIGTQLGDVSPDYQDNTQIQNNPGTVRQFLGNGYLSNGIASNGKGNYGIEGTLTGINQNMDEQNILNQLLGINSAQASEAPMMSSMSQQIPYNQNNWMGVPNYGVLPNTPTIQGNEEVANQSNVASYQPKQQGGGVTQQYTQGTTGGSQGVAGFDNSGYKKAQKAQEKALKELIKSIKAEYATSEKEGTTALNKSKQEDLLKLSGLFNFANQDPNSEQRLQYEQRSRNDYAGQLKDFLAKLSQGRAKDISSVKTNYQSSLADILSQQQKAQQDYENMMWDRQYKTASLNKSSGGSQPKQAATYAPDGSYTFNETDPITGKKIFYDPKTNEPFYYS